MLSKQLRNRLSAGKNGNWTSGMILIRVGRVDSEAIVYRRQQAIAVHDPLDRLFISSVRGADDLPHFQPRAVKELRRSGSSLNLWFKTVQRTVSRRKRSFDPGIPI